MNQTQLLLILFQFAATVSVVGVAVYALARWVERRKPMLAIAFGVMGGFLSLLLIPLAFSHHVWLILLVVFVFFSWIGGAAHRSSGGVSKDGLQAWLVMIIAGELTLLFSVIFLLTFVPPSRSFNRWFLNNQTLFILLFGSACFISPNAIALFLRASQVLKLRPGIDRHLQEGDMKSESTD